MSEITIQPLTPNDQDWVSQFIREHWGDNTVISRGVVYTPSTLPGFVALLQGERVGLLTYALQGDECEVVSIDSTRSGLGIGTMLIEAVKGVARSAGCSRLWLITTNDNLNALRFYQKRGFVLVTIHRNALEASRKLKPTIPLIGYDGIPLRDEIELEMMLQ
jgi:ribosomal protein S18 acetylase RimI-like enzyme